MTTTRARLTAVCLVLGLWIAAGAVSAADNGVLEEVVVTATKRTASVQDVPLAVTAYTGADLQKRGVYEVTEIAQVSPSVTINTLGNNTQTIVRIRGVGTDGVNVGFESSVGMFIDGVFRPRAGQALGNLLDVDRIEVLRGPQGTLFGKNTSAGAIHIITAAPEFDFGGEASASIGDFDSTRLTGIVTGPIVADTLAYRVAVTSAKRDGILDKLGPGANPTMRTEHYYNDRDRFAAKGQLLYTPNDNFSARLIVDHSSLDDIGNISMPLILGPVSRLGFAGGVLGVPPGTPFSSQGLNDLGAFEQPDYSLDDLQAQNNSDPLEDVDDAGAVLDIDWSRRWGSLTAITAVRDFDSFRTNDLDLVGAEILGPLDESTHIHQISTEIRANGGNDVLDWLAGVYVFDETIDFTSVIRIGSQFSEFFGGGLPSGIFTNQGARQRGTQDTEGFALFTHNVVHLSDRFELTAGLRYNSTDKHGISIVNDNPPNTPSVSDPICALLPFITAICDNRSVDRMKDENEVTGTVGLRYELNDDMSAYVSYASGYKAGGINLDRESISDAGGTVLDLSEFPPEWVDSYEMGWRSEWLGNRALLNVTAFHSDFTDFQLNAFNGLAFTVISIDKAVSKGVELDWSMLFTDRLQLDLGASYIDARFADELDGGIQDAYEGLRLPESSLRQADAALSGEANLPSGRLLLTYGGTVSYRSAARSGSTPAPEQRQGGYSLWGAWIGLRNASDRFELTLRGTNLGDKIVAPFISPTIFQEGSFSAYVNTPRMITLTAATHF